LRSFYESAGGAKLMDVIRSPDFRQAVEALGGYDASHSGEVIYEQ
jgi:hypothetical protein